MPLPIGYYGVKVGLANCVTLFALYRLRVWDAVILTVLRVILAGLAFGGLTGMLYSLCGASLSLCVMILLRRTGLHVIGVSVAGGVAHNIGQIAVAVVLTDTPGLWWYLPVLLVAGTLNSLGKQYTISILVFLARTAPNLLNIRETLDWLML